VICPRCQIERPTNHVQRAGQGYVFDCPQCGAVPWSPTNGQSWPIVLYPENLAAHRRSGESAQRRRWYDVARRRWLSGRTAPRVQEC
jgi:hypothetical protein